MQMQMEMGMGMTHKGGIVFDSYEYEYEGSLLSLLLYYNVVNAIYVCTSLVL